jgi:ferredoxin
MNSEEIEKHPLNARGKYYVDQDCCTFSGNCLVVAPGCFKMDEENRVYVIKQPSTAQEEARCQQALRECPVAAIIDNGEI